MVVKADVWEDFDFVLGELVIQHFMFLRDAMIEWPFGILKIIKHLLEFKVLAQIHG